MSENDHFNTFTRLLESLSERNVLDHPQYGNFPCLFWFVYGKYMFIVHSSPLTQKLARETRLLILWHNSLNEQASEWIKFQLFPLTDRLSL